jgi:hypothetical protein
MSWAEHAIKELQAGRQVQIRPRGHSMKGRVNDGDLVTLLPVKEEDLAVDDVVLVHIHGRDYLHLVKAKDGNRLQIGNNRGGINGWVGSQAVYGKAIRIER